MSHQNCWFFTKGPSNPLMLSYTGNLFAQANWLLFIYNYVILLISFMNWSASETQISFYFLILYENAHTWVIRSAFLRAEQGNKGGIPLITILRSRTGILAFLNKILILDLFFILLMITYAGLWIILWLICIPRLTGYVEELSLKVEGIKMQ